RATTFGLFTALAFIVLLCYGGGFGTMPAFAADYFGPKNVGSVYGLMLTAWGVAGIVGPTLIARIRESTGAYSNALYVISGIMLVSAIIPFIVRPPLSQQEAAVEHRPAGALVEVWPLWGQEPAGTGAGSVRVRPERVVRCSQGGASRAPTAPESVSRTVWRV